MYDKAQILSDKLSLIVNFGGLALFAHLANDKPVLQWVLRAIIFGVGLLESLALIFCGISDLNAWIVTVAGATTLLLLFAPVRELASWFFTGLDLIITLQMLVPLIRKKVKPAEYFLSKKIFLSRSLPHLMALTIYIIASFYMLINVGPDGLKLFGLPFLNQPISEQLLPYSGIALILLSFCGIGIYISRSYKDAFQRLGWVNPTKAQIGIGLILVLFCFVYNALWIIYTHNWGRQDLATNLSYYNCNTFTMAGQFVPSIILALVLTACAGIGEETLFRGALQPVFGILPSALMHGLMFGLFVHSPVFILQVTIWSVLMGLVKRYTNTSTTIIGHAGFNMITIALFAFNP